MSPIQPQQGQPLQTPLHQVDPLRWCALLALAFTGFALWRIGIPSAPYFDELHYLPAARAVLDLSGYPNREHPMLGKEIIAAGIALFGDNAFGWRFFAVLAGGMALFASMRAMWFASEQRFATLAFGILLASGFLLFVQMRIAMLDIFMAAFFAGAMWQCAAACREPERGRMRLAIAGVALGCAMASKWNVVPLAVLPGITFFVARVLAHRRRPFLSRRGLPVPGVSLAEAALWLGVVPLAVYALTFAPIWFVAGDPMDGTSLIALHREIIELQASVKQEHPYQSNWDQWMLNTRAIWYLYEEADGALRGFVLLGNPLTMLLGLPALVWCAWAGIFRGRHDAWAVLVLYSVSMGLWLVADKPIQFYYHYLLPSCFLLAGLALALNALWRMEIWRNAGKVLAGLVLAASAGMFGWFFPILSGLPLSHRQAFADWMWLMGWR